MFDATLTVAIRRNAMFDLHGSANLITLTIGDPTCQLMAPTFSNPDAMPSQRGLEVVRAHGALTLRSDMKGHAALRMVIGTSLTAIVHAVQDEVGLAKQHVERDLKFLDEDVDRIMFGLFSIDFTRFPLRLRLTD